MPLRDALDRRGRPERGSAGLLERDEALEAIAQLLDDVDKEQGGAILIEAHAGMGKTRLHEAALDRARSRGMRVLRAAASDLERSVAFGVARQLLRLQLRDLSAARRRSLLANATHALEELAGLAPEAAGQPRAPSGDLALIHELFALFAAADETRPALIAIDDLHWSDTASIEFMLYVLQRLEELPVAIVLTQRPRIGGESESLLDRIAANPRVSVLQLAPLGLEAVEELVRRARGSAEDDLIAACASVTAGNPFFVRELLHALSEESELEGEALITRALSLAPDAVARSLRVRIGRLGPGAGALARAIAILGDDVPLRRAASLAGLPLEHAAGIADELASVDILLAREPLRFVHPLVRHTVELDIPAAERATRHLEAGRLLYAESEDSEHVAAHLLLGRPETNPWVVEQLRAAADSAQMRGAAGAAAKFLERALSEPPGADIRADVLSELGNAEAAAGVRTAAQRLAAAAECVTDPRRRAALALRRGHALFSQGLHDQAARAYEDGLTELEGISGDGELDELQLELQTGFTATGSIATGLHAHALERFDQLLLHAPPGPVTHPVRLLFAQAAVHASLAAAPAVQVVELAERAWDGGRLLDRETPDEVGWALVASAFSLSGELERSLVVVDAVLDEARRRSLPLAFATASYVRAMPRLWQGAVTDAIADLELTRSARRYGWKQFIRSAASSYCLCLIEAGELDRAEQALCEDEPLDRPRDLEDIRRMYALGELRLAQGRAADAYEAAMTTGEALGSSIKVFGYCPWRDTAANAALALGERQAALELARDMRAIAEQTGVLYARVRALRLHGKCEEGERSLELLRWAVELGESAPPRLETIRALLDYGSSLRRANQRAAAREPLQRAADMAQRGGASALYERARTELSAAGARPRRAMILEGAGSLTPSERRIAELASSGRSNPEIARALFVTPKTVEYHLRNVYRKLDIKRRGELPQALAGPDPGYFKNPS